MRLFYKRPIQGKMMLMGSLLVKTLEVTKIPTRLRNEEKFSFSSCRWGVCGWSWFQGPHTHHSTPPRLHPCYLQQADGMWVVINL